MFSRFAAIAFVILTVIASTSFAQGDYLSRGESGFEFHAGFSSNSDATGFGGGASYSINGVADLALSLTGISFDAKFLGEDLKGTALVPSVTLYPVKQDSINVPLSAAVRLAYERDTYSSDALDVLDWDMSSNFWGFGLALFKNIRTTQTTVIEPRISAEYMTGSLRMKDSFGNYEDVDDNITAFGLGLSVLLESSKNTSALRIDPSITISEGNTTISIVAGYIFKTP